MDCGIDASWRLTPEMTLLKLYGLGPFCWLLASPEAVRVFVERALLAAENNPPEFRAFVEACSPFVAFVLLDPNNEVLAPKPELWEVEFLPKRLDVDEFPNKPPPEEAGVFPNNPEDVPLGLEKPVAAFQLLPCDEVPVGPNIIRRKI